MSCHPEGRTSSSWHPMVVSRVCSGISQLARLDGSSTRNNEVRSEVTMTTVGWMDPCKLHPFFIFPVITMSQKLKKTAHKHVFLNGNCIKSSSICFLPNIRFSLSVQTSDTDLFVTHPLPFLLRGI